jgi:hypothetical protein
MLTISSWSNRIYTWRGDYNSPGMQIVRTPDERFRNLPGYDFAPHYANVAGLRMHYIDAGPPSAATC